MVKKSGALCFSSNCEIEEGEKDKGEDKVEGIGRHGRIDYVSALLW